MYTSCRHCHVGRSKPTIAPLFAVYDNQPLIVTDAPAYMCDVCGVVEHDAEYLRGINALISQHPAGATTATVRPNRRTYSFGRHPSTTGG